MPDGELPDATRPYDETILSDPAMIDGRRIVLHAERPVVETRVVQDRVAIISRRSVVERRTIEVDLLREELSVEYRPADGSDGAATAFETTIVQLRAEDVEIVKRVRVVEEVTISKRTVTERERRPVTLREERLDTSDLTPS